MRQEMRVAVKARLLVVVLLLPGGLIVDTAACGGGNLSTGRFDQGFVDRVRVQPK
jgi:hypothetical protein